VNNNSIGQNVKRITADFSPEAYQTLERVASKLNTTKADALRRALGLIDLVISHQREGWKLTLQNAQTKDRKEIITI
jgi:hypothetical protein